MLGCENLPPAQPCDPMLVAQVQDCKAVMSSANRSYFRCLRTDLQAAWEPGNAPASASASSHSCGPSNVPVEALVPNSAAPKYPPPLQAGPTFNQVELAPSQS